MYVRLPKPLDEMTPEEIQEFTEDTDKRLAVFYTYIYRYRQKGLEPSINGSTPATETPPVSQFGCWRHQVLRQDHEQRHNFLNTVDPHCLNLARRCPRLL